jgi:rhodanese-related sulfurtransferase
MNHLEAVRNILQVAASSATAAAILNHVATRKNLRKAETVRRLVQVCGSGTTRASVVAVLRQLEATGFGKVVVGRRGHESRFEWAGV